MKKQLIRSIGLLSAGIAFLFWAAVSLPGTGVRAAGTEGVFVLPVFETSDTHGYLADSAEGKNEYRLAYISDKVHDVRGYGDAYRKELALLLDGGDIYQGNTLSNLQNGRYLSAAYKMMDYDAVTIGNHEFDWKIENTVDADGTMIDAPLATGTLVNDVPVVSSNLYHNGEKVDFAEDYVILEKTARDGAGNERTVRIAVIGYSEDYASSILYTNFTGAGYAYVVDYGKLNALARELEESGQCDATILLTHAGAGDSASALGGGTVIDLVLGGHTHRSEAGRTGGGVSYAQPANAAQAYAYAELVFKVNDGRVSFEKITNVGAEPIPLGKLENTPENREELDGEIVALSDDAFASIEDVMNTELGYITTSSIRGVSLAYSNGRASTAGNWMASLIRRAVNADVGFYNGGGVRADLRLSAGASKRVVTASDIYSMFPFQNKIYCYEMTYEDYMKLLDYAMLSNGSTLLTIMEGMDCYFKGEKVVALFSPDGGLVYANGVWKEGWKDEKIRVAVNEFSATTNRKAYGVSNPLIAWNSTERLVSSDLVDVEGALEVLRREAAENDGHLYVDDKAHFTEREFKDPGWYLKTDGTLVLERAFSWDGKGDAPWVKAAGKISRVEVDFGVKSIPAGAFAACDSLSEVIYYGEADTWDWIEIGDEKLSSGGVTVKFEDRRDETEDPGNETPAENEVTYPTPLQWVVAGLTLLLLAGAITLFILNIRMKKKLKAMKAEESAPQEVREEPPAETKETE